MNTENSGGRELSDTSRIKGFSDGVFAVIITITVLSIEAPKDPTFKNLLEVAPLFFAYILSFTNLGIYWSNHHHLLYSVKKVKASIMWANLLLLFFLSLIPVSTIWIGTHPNDTAPVVTYGALLLCCAIAYTILQKTILNFEHKDSLLRKAIGNDTKGKLSLSLSLSLSLAVLIVGISAGFFVPWVSYLCYIAIVLMWVIPDKRLEDALSE